MWYLRIQHIIISGIKHGVKKDKVCSRCLVLQTDEFAAKLARNKKPKNKLV